MREAGARATTGGAQRYTDGARATTVGAQRNAGPAQTIIKKCKRGRTRALLSETCAQQGLGRMQKMYHQQA